LVASKRLVPAATAPSIVQVIDTATERKRLAAELERKEATKASSLAKAAYEAARNCGDPHNIELLGTDRDKARKRWEDPSKNR
jgi:hypothetical protein